MWLIRCFIAPRTGRREPSPSREAGSAQGERIANRLRGYDLPDICRNLHPPSLRGSDLSKCRLVGPTSLEAGLEIVLNRAVSARVWAPTPPGNRGREGRTAWMRMAIDTAAKTGPRARPGQAMPYRARAPHSPDQANGSMKIPLPPSSHG